MAQQQWTLSVQSTALSDRLEAGFVHLDVIIGLAGCAVSLLLAALARVLLSARARALREVVAATGELRQQHDRHERLLGTLSTMGEGVVVVEDDRIVFANEAFAHDHRLPARGAARARLRPARWSPTTRRRGRSSGSARTSPTAARWSCS